MIVILNDNTICDNTHLNDPKNKKGLVIPSLFKIRKQLYDIKNPPAENDYANCSGEDCMNDHIFDFFLDNNKDNSKDNSKTKTKTKTKKLKLKLNNKSKKK
tara:strand:- start:90 stop:392 length:303 start_codon:yes stop_codon:yes gene_type:complete